MKRHSKEFQNTHTRNDSTGMPKFDLQSFHIIAYSDSAITKCAELSLQLGRIELSTGSENNSIKLSYESYKSRIFSRSVLFEIGVDISYFLNIRMQYVSS